MNELLTIRLSKLEQIIERGQQTFIEVGMALAEIREERLYKNDFNTFEDYCLDRWGWSASRSRRLISSAEAVAAMESVPTGTLSETMPKVQNERQARSLAKIKDPEIRSQIWQQVSAVAKEVEIAVTSKLIDKAAQAQKQIELKESGRGLPLPAGSPSPEAFKSEIKNLNSAKWQDSLYDILVMTNAIRDNGGIANLAMRWNLNERRAYLEKIERLQTTLDKINRELKETIEYAEN